MSKSRPRIDAIVSRLLGRTGIIFGVLFLTLAAALHVRAQMAGQDEWWKVPVELAFVLSAEVGAVLITLSLLHLIHDRMVRESFLNDVRMTLGELLDIKLGDIQRTYESYRRLLDIGVVDGRMSFPDEEMKEMLSKARRIRILKTWFPESQKLEDGLKNALLKRQCSVELLLCHPDSELLRIRSLSAGKGKDEGRAKVIGALRQVFACACSQHSGSFQIGLYDGWPAVPIVCCDNRMFLGLYLRGESSPSNPWLEIDSNSYLGKKLNSQFESMWKISVKKLTNCVELQEWLTNSQNEKAPGAVKNEMAASPHSRGEILVVEFPHSPSSAGT